MEQMRQNQTWTRELAEVWTELHDMQEAKPALAEALQLNEQRRRASGLHDDQCKLESDFAMRLRHLNKIAGEILDRPDSTASELIQNVSLKAKPAGNISLGEESNSAVKDPEPSACAMKESSVHME